MSLTYIFLIQISTLYNIEIFSICLLESYFNFAMSVPYVYYYYYYKNKGNKLIYERSLMFKFILYRKKMFTCARFVYRMNIIKDLIQTACYEIRLFNRSKCDGRGVGGQRVKIMYRAQF